MNRERRIGLFLLAIIIFVILAVVAVVITRESNSLYYTAVFRDAKGLKTGDLVQMSGVNIGVVKFVQLNTQPDNVHVRLKIDPPYAANVRQNSTAIIRSVSLPNVSDQRVVEVINPAAGPPPPALPKESLVQGVEGPLDLQIWKVRAQLPRAGGALAEAIDAMGRRLRDLSDSVREFADSPQAREAFADLRAFLRTMHEDGSKALGQLHEQWPKIKDKLQPVLVQLESLGRTHVVEEVRQIFRQVDQTLADWQRQPTPTPAPAEAMAQ